MKKENYQYISDLVKRRSGLVLTEDKIYLLESRLSPLARKEGLANVDDFISKMRSAPNEALMSAVTEAMTTNESFFFRDKTPFEHLEKFILPQLAKSRSPSQKVRIWCCAASTGQEPYSISMVLKENQGKFGHLKTEILGTDISRQVLEKAKAGLYSQFEVQRGMPIQMLVKYFDQVKESWALKPEIKAMVQYRYFNLLDDFSSLGTWDVIFCRNVLIYFDQPTKKDIMRRLAKQLTPDGYLLLGAAETVLGISDAFKPVDGYRGLYALARSSVASPSVPEARVSSLRSA